MSRYPKADLSGISLISIANRSSKVAEAAWATPVDAEASLRDFVDSLPDILIGRDLREFAQLAADTVRLKKPLILMMGAHVIKVGLAPLICDLLERGILTGVAMNSASAIHDTESCLFGETSEDVAATITDGSFGMSRETGEFINGTLRDAYVGEDKQMGFGEALGLRLLQQQSSRPSIMATCVRLGIPITIHAAIGTDIIHQQPSMSGEVTGELSFRDFKALAYQLHAIGDGGVVMNVGSAVLMPEVFLKALTIVRNLGTPAFNFTTANFDMLQHYRPRVNVVQRPTQDGGRGFTFTGHHEIMFPLVAAMIKMHVSAIATGDLSSTNGAATGRQ